MPKKYKNSDGGVEEIYSTSETDSIADAAVGTNPPQGHAASHVPGQSDQLFGVGLHQSASVLIGDNISAGSSSDFEFALPGLFCDLQGVHLTIDDTTTISDAAIAFYDTEANRDANGGTPDPTDAGLQILLENIDDAASASPATMIESVLGVIKAFNDGGTPKIYGRVWNLDGSNACDFTLGVEAYPRLGTRAV